MGQKQLDPKRLVFIDETGAKKHGPTRGRCRRGQRLDDDVHAALRDDGVAAPFGLDGPVNGECFLAYVKEALARRRSQKTYQDERERLAIEKRRLWGKLEGQWRSCSERAIGFGRIIVFRRATLIP